MRAIDTNILVRFITADHPQQSPRAREIIEGGDILVSVTVLLEAEWVLRSTYGYDPALICKKLEGFAGMPGVTVEDPEHLAFAMDRVRDGMDFADALHLARADSCTVFLTFDRRLVKAAKGLGAVEAILA